MRFPFSLAYSQFGRPVRGDHVGTKPLPQPRSHGLRNPASAHRQSRGVCDGQRDFLVLMPNGM